MVYLNNEMIREVPAEMGGLVSDDELKRLGVTQFARLEIPLRSIKGVSAYREVADILRGLATSMEVLARSSDKTEKARVILVMHEILSANRKVKALTISSDRRIDQTK